MVAESINITERCPYYHKYVPKDYRANLLFREMVVQRGFEDEKFAHAMWTMAKRDMLFWINVFVWTFDPRKTGRGENTVNPFITYPFQDEALLEYEDAIGDHDIVTVKSRDMGASWMNLFSMIHQWQFEKMRSFLVVSRNEDYVDKPGNPKSLFWKIDFLLEKQAGWMIHAGQYHRRSMGLISLETGSMFDGESTTGDIARGDRRTGILADELAAVKLDDGFRAIASLSSATNCRMYNSTPRGSDNAFHDRAHRSGIRRLNLHWSVHPEKNQGLYTSLKGRLILKDVAYWCAEGHCSPHELDAAVRDRRIEYEFRLDDKLRSPWYDDQCDEIGIKSIIAQELDMDFLGSGSLLFDPGEIRRIEELYAMPPLRTIDLKDAERLPKGIPCLSYVVESDCKLKLWVPLDGENKPPRDQGYVMGADISLGSGATPSALVVYGARNREKVAEFVNRWVDPSRFAQLYAAVGRWFVDPTGNEAFANWESNGPGATFTNELIRLGYRNFHYHKKNPKDLHPKVSGRPGWWSQGETKQTVLLEYARAIATGECVNRSVEAILECLEWQIGPSGVYHSKAAASSDPSAKGDKHGDVVIADATAWMAMKERSSAKSTEALAPPASSLAHRRGERTKQERELAYVI